MSKRIRAVAAVIAVAMSILTSNSNAHAADSPCHVALAEWTLLVYLNADNNLEPDGFANFQQMATVGSSPLVNVIVQFDRSGKHHTSKPQWARTLRFCVERGMAATPAKAVMDMGSSLDMGDGGTLADFVAWGMATYPARQTALVIWDHGQGWRGVEPRTKTGHNYPSPFRSASGAAFKSVSFDETSNDELYNRKIQDALTAQLRGSRIAVIGFDACLMQMLETAYAMRGIARVQIGSEDLEPGLGWPYQLILARLEAAVESANPPVDAETLAAIVVTAYRDTYGGGSETLADPTTTMSAMRLDLVQQLAAATSTFADDMRAILPTQRDVITAARSATAVFAPDPYRSKPPHDAFFGIDLARFAALIENTTTGKLAADARQVESLVSQAVIVNFAGAARSTAPFGASGIAIYFPPNADAYANDESALHGYEPANTQWPVEFVQNERWPAFLNAYWSAAK